MAVHVDFTLSWLASARLSEAHATMVLRLVDAVRRRGSLQRAAGEMGVSYRYAWGLLGEAAAAFGAPLVEMQRGRGAHPTPLGEKLLWADGVVHAALDPQFGRLRQQIESELSKALPRRLPRLSIQASHDLALAEFTRLCAGKLDIEIMFKGSDDCLAALANGKCDIAGFHVADALPRAAAAAAALGRWLDPQEHLLLHFVTREQGLIARPDSHIRSVHDLTRPGVRFINRQSGSGGRGMEREETSVAAAVAEERADAGFGLRADAMRFRLDFVPLSLERYFLAFPRAVARAESMQRLLAILRSADFAQQVALLPGYDAATSGKRERLDAALNWVERTRRQLRSPTGKRNRATARTLAGNATR
ncbi:MAG: substrate-binding domain-containing protein [Betaproteobacteria bacterium]